MREFLKGLELDKETIDTIMAEYGKLVTENKEQLNKLENQVKDYESKIGDLTTKAEKNSNVEKELNELKAQIKQENEVKEKERKDAILNANIESALNGKKFTSKYAKDGFYNEIKLELAKEENEGKGITDIINYLSKDQTGIFEQENKMVDIPPVADVDNVVTKDTFNKMSYNERVKLKAENPDLFKKLNN